MGVALAVPLFVASLTVTLFSARLFARRLDGLGVRLGFPEALVGLLTALAADGPEVSSALFALARGEHGVGVGVLVGSNAFNLAAMIGVSGLLAGSVRLARATLWLEGLVGAAITLVGSAVLLGWLSPGLAAALAGAVLAAYLLVVVGGAEVLWRGAAGARAERRLLVALEQRPSRARTVDSMTDPVHHLLGLIVMDVVLIVAGSVGMVQAALALGGRWGVSAGVLGVLVLAPLTSVPNAITGVRLGVAGRGGALVGETLNSNTINFAAGVIVPSLFVVLSAPSATARLQIGWLVGMTAVALGLLARAEGLRRPGAFLLIGLYAGFVVLQLSGA